MLRFFSYLHSRLCRGKKATTPLAPQQPNQPDASQPHGPPRSDTNKDSDKFWRNKDVVKQRDFYNNGRYDAGHCTTDEVLAYHKYREDHPDHGFHEDHRTGLRQYFEKVDPKKARRGWDPKA